MADKDKKPQAPQFNSRTTVIAVVLVCLVALFVGSQFFSMGSASGKPTDSLLSRPSSLRRSSRTA